jgi:hypothetical protein
VSLELGGVAPVPQPFDQADGVKLPTTPGGRRGFLSDVIIELGFVPREVVDEAVDMSREVGRPPEEILRENGALSEENLAAAIAERNGLPYVDLSVFRVDKGAARLIDRETGQRYRAVPIAVDATGALVVALSDPMDALAVNDIGVITKNEVRTAVASDSGIESVLETLPESQRRARLSAHGPDGFAGGRTAESGEWSLSRSISSPEPLRGAPAVLAPDTVPAIASPVPVVTPAPEPAQPVAATPAAESPAPGPPAELESRIDALVAAALDKHLSGAAGAAPPAAAEPGVAAGAGDDELARARAEQARAQEEADQARAEVEALSARLEQLERAAQPQPSPAAPVAPPPAEPASVEARLDDHLERVMRELGGAGR